MHFPIHQQSSLFFGLLFFLGGSFLRADETFRHEIEAVRMGVPVKIVLYTEKAELAKLAFEEALAELNRLDGIFSDYDSDSELMTVCRRASTPSEQNEPGEWMPVSDDLFAVLKASRYFGEISNGAFDVTVGPMVRLWRRSRRQRELPKPHLLDHARQLVGRNLWELDEGKRRVRLLKPGMRLDLGGIAKGYAIDRIFDGISRHGLTTLLVDFGGDLRVGNAPPEGWKIRLASGKTVGKTVFLENRALATSGDADRYVEIDGVRYSHLIDPKTGLGLARSPVVHVAAPTAMEADALASALSVLGGEKGIDLAETQKNVSAKITLHGDEIVFQTENWLEIQAPLND